MADTTCSEYNQLVSWIIDYLKRREPSKEKTFEFWLFAKAGALPSDRAKREKVLKIVIARMIEDKILFRMGPTTDIKSQKYVWHPSFNPKGAKLSRREHFEWGSRFFTSIQSDAGVDEKISTIEDFLFCETHPINESKNASSTSTKRKSPPSKESKPPRKNEAMQLRKRSPSPTQTQMEPSAKRVRTSESSQKVTASPVVIFDTGPGPTNGLKNEQLMSTQPIDLTRDSPPPQAKDNAAIRPQTINRFHDNTTSRSSKNSTFLQQIPTPRLTERFDDQDRKIGELTKQISAFSSELTFLQDLVKAQDKKIKELEADAETKKKEDNSLRDEIKTLRTLLERQNSESTSQISSLQNASTAQEDKISSLQNLVLVQEDKTKTLESDTETQKKGDEEFRKETKALFEKYDSESASKISSLQDLITSQDEKFKKLGTDTKAKKELEEEMKQGLARLDLHMSTVDVDITALRSNSILYEDSIRHLEKNAKAQKKLDEELRQGVYHRMSTLDEKIKSLEASTLSRETDYNVSKQELRDLIDEYGTELAQLEAEAQTRKLDEEAFRKGTWDSTQAHTNRIDELEKDAKQRKEQDEAFRKELEDHIEARLVDLMTEDANEIELSLKRIKDLERDSEKHASQITTLQARLKGKDSEKPSD